MKDEQDAGTAFLHPSAFILLPSIIACRRRVVVEMRFEPFVPFGGGFLVEGLAVFLHRHADEACHLRVEQFFEVHRPDAASQRK